MMGIIQVLLVKISFGNGLQRLSAGILGAGEASSPTKRARDR